MKLAPTLAKYLSANKQVSLPGLGTFSLQNAYDPDYDGKRPVATNSVSFVSEKIESADDDLIEYIAKETGKMKVLASSDLSSQLGDVITYLNSGKPYFFQGIGTLTRKVNGEYDFFPERFSMATDKKKEKEIPITEKNIVPQTYIDNTKVRSKSAKPAIIIITLSLIAIAATVWFYLKSTEDKTSTSVEETTEEQASEPGTTQVPDTAAAKTNATANAPASNTYTYVLEVAKEPRASKRFSQLKTINWPVELEVVDSTTKRIIMKLPVAGNDSTRVKDSLSALSGRKVFIAR